MEAGPITTRLVAELRPVDRLRAPYLRALSWLGMVAAFGVALAGVADLGAVEARLASVPDMWLAPVGSAATCALAALSAFEVSLPDRSRGWTLLPLPGLLLWIAASGEGCARSWLVPGTHKASWSESRGCLVFIVGVSLPLSLLTFGMLRRAYSMDPALTGGLAGLAVAAAAATLLNLFHPYDAALDDLLVHATAVVAVVVANRLASGSLAPDARRGRPGIAPPPTSPRA